MVKISYQLLLIQSVRPAEDKRGIHNKIRDLVARTIFWAAHSKKL